MWLPDPRRVESFSPDSYDSSEWEGGGDGVVWLLSHKWPYSCRSSWFFIFVFCFFFCLMMTPKEWELNPNEVTSRISSWSICWKYELIRLQKVRLTRRILKRSVRCKWIRIRSKITSLQGREDNDDDNDADDEEEEEAEERMQLPAPGVGKSFLIASDGCDFDDRRK